MLGRVGVGADEGEEGVGGVGGGGPDFLAVDDEVVAVADGAGGERGEVGAGAGFGVALRPGDFAGEDRGQVLAFLLVGAVHDQGGAEHGDAGAADGGGAGFGHFLAEDELLHGGESAAADFGGPVGRDPAALGEGGVPVDGGAALGLVGGFAVVFPGAFGHRAAGGEVAVAGGQARADQVADLAAECGLVGVVGPVHGRLPSGGLAGRSRVARGIRREASGSPAGGGRRCRGGRRRAR